MQTNLYDAKTHLSELVDRALAGEEIVIARNGTPLVRLIAIARPRQAGLLVDTLPPLPDSFFEPLPDEEIEAWEV